VRRAVLDAIDAISRFRSGRGCQRSRVRTSGRPLLSILERQAVVANSAVAVALGTFSDGTAPPSAHAVQELEHQGEKDLPEMEGEAFARTVVTRSIARIAQSLRHDRRTFDLTNGAARACTLFEVERQTER